MSRFTLYILNANIITPRHFAEGDPNILLSPFNTEGSIKKNDWLSANQNTLGLIIHIGNMDGLTKYELEMLERSSALFKIRF